MQALSEKMQNKFALNDFLSTSSVQENDKKASGDEDDGKNTIATFDTPTSVGDGTARLDNFLISF